MKFFLVLLTLMGIAYGGYLYYRQSQLDTSVQYTTTSLSSNNAISSATSKFDNFASVLGASISRSITHGTDFINQATGGASEPIINQLITKTQETLKDLPQKEAERIKYEFCRGVIEEYENQSSSE